jgi:uncharacterized protein DUF2568
MGGFWNGLWLAAAFVSELAALAALAVWGWSLSGSGPLRLAAAVGLPLVAAVLWGVFAAPRAPVRRRGPAAAVKVAVLGGAVLGLLLTGHVPAAVALAVGSVLGAVLPVAPGPAVTAPADR